MKTILNEVYTVLEPSNWKFSASIVGLKKYFDFLINENILENDVYSYDEDKFTYKPEYITEEYYLKFVEYYYCDYLHHIRLQNLLNKTDFTEDDIVHVNCILQNKESKKLNFNSSNTICKNVFKGYLFDGTNRLQILNVLNENRQLLIKESFIKSPKMFKMYFHNHDKLLLKKEEQKIVNCRLKGYYLDLNKKSKGNSWCYSNNYLSEDILEFNFICFGFSKEYDSIFINNNYSLNSLFKSNINELKGNKNGIYGYINSILNANEYLTYDIEVIKISMSDNSNYETFFVKKDIIDMLRKIKNFNSLNYSLNINSKTTIYVSQEVVNRIFNNCLLDDIISLTLKNNLKIKEKVNKEDFKLKVLININNLLYQKIYNRKESDMTKSQKATYGCAKQLAYKLENNKINSYKFRLLTAINSNDKDKIFQLLNRIGTSENIQISFLFDLLEDFESNKNLVYTFINAFNKDTSEKNEEK